MCVCVAYITGVCIMSLVYVCVAYVTGVHVCVAYVTGVRVSLVYVTGVRVCVRMCSRCYPVPVEVRGQLAGVCSFLKLFED